MECEVNFEKLNNTTLPIITLQHNNVEFKMLVDTGSDCNYIDASVLDLLVTTPSEKYVENIVFGSGGAEGKYYYHSIPVVIGNKEFTLDVVPVDLYSTVKDFRDYFGVTIRGLLGSEFLSKYGFTLDMDNRVMYIDNSLKNDLPSNQSNETV